MKHATADRNRAEEAHSLTMQGHEFRRHQDWQHAIECYKRAIDLAPGGEAQTSLEMLEDILSQWNRGMYDV